MIIPIILIAIMTIGVLTGQVKFSDFFSTGDEFYEDVYEAYENSEDVKITDEDRIATFDFDNFAFVIHYFGDDLIRISCFEKEDDMYRFSGEEVGKEIGKDEKNINGFGGHEFSHNGDSIEFDIVSNVEEVPDGYKSEEIKLHSKNALFAYKIY